MAEAQDHARTGPLAHHPALSLPRKLEIGPGVPLARFSYRGPVGAPTTRAFGVKLPAEINTVETKNQRTAICLGPDEWLILAPEGEQAALVEASARMRAAHSLVEISHRNTSIIVEGRRAVDVLATVSPLDLHRHGFPVRMATRTILGKVEVVLWRTETDRFHIEVWRSFSDYLFKLLSEGAREYRVPQRSK